MGICVVVGTMVSEAHNNRAEYDKSLHEARREIDLKVQKDRAEVDKKLKKERSYVDRMIKEEREEFSRKMAKMRLEIEEKYKRNCEYMKKKVCPWLQGNASNVAEGPEACGQYYTDRASQDGCLCVAGTCVYGQ